MGNQASTSYICKTCNSMFFYESDVMAHKSMTGHYQFEKRGGQNRNEEPRQELYKQLEEHQIPTKALDSLPVDALQELLRALKKATSTYKEHG